MILQHLFLQNFRSYTKSQFDFSQGITVILGPNTVGKTNIIEAVYLLGTGKSFRAEKDREMILFNKELGRIKGKIDGKDGLELEVVLTTGNVSGVDTPLKRFLVNGVAKRRVDFIGHIASVLFSPADLEIVVDSPSIRRAFLDDALIQIDRFYGQALSTYTKALRQRNALLELAREKGVRSQKQFDYWDEIVIKNGEVITQRRGEFMDFLNAAEKEIFDFNIVYDKSIISNDRLAQYKDAEIGAGVTLVGPHRDDMQFQIPDSGFRTPDSEAVDAKMFGSRGQQRLVVLQLKLLQLLYMEKALGKRPLLLLDDIFSELDEKHIQLVHKIMDKQQTIITTTHEEFMDKKFLKEASVVELR